MSQKCEGCPLNGTEIECLGTVDPLAFPFCQWDKSDESKRRHIVGRSKIGLAPPPEAPGLAARVANFAAAAVQHVAAGAPTVPTEVKAARLAICRSNECGRYQDGQCLACGCSGRMLEWKATWADQRCPLNPPRWGPVDPAAT